MFCPECGEEIKDNVKFCKSCGASLDNENNVKNHNNASKIPCQNCGKMISSNASRCEFCGMSYNLDSEDGKEKYQVPVIMGYLLATIGQFIPILAIILFIVGLGIGVYLWTQDNAYAKKHGKYIVIIGLVIFLITFIIGFMIGLSSTL